MAANHSHQDRPYNCFAPIERQLRAALAAAYGMIEMVDDAIGTILATLNELNIDDKTVVIFTSDSASI